MSAVSRRNTVFSPMKDFGSLFQPNPLFMSSKMRSFPPRVIEFDNLFLGRLVVICKDAAVGVFSFHRSISPSIRFCLWITRQYAPPFPFLNKNGVQFKLNAAQFLSLPPSECKDVIVERTAAVGADIESHAMLSDLFHNFL